MEVVLVMFRADGERRSFPLLREVTVIGRREDCDLRIPLTEVSRKHCRLVRSGDRVRVEDLGSSNGTYHNNARIQESTVEPGDAIQVGPVTFVVQIDNFPPDDDIHPPVTPSADPGNEVDVHQPGVKTTIGKSPAFAGRPETPLGSDDFLINDPADDSSERPK